MAPLDGIFPATVHDTAFGTVSVHDSEGHVVFSLAQERVHPGSHGAGKTVAKKAGGHRAPGRGSRRPWSRSCCLRDQGVTFAVQSLLADLALLEQAQQVGGGGEIDIHPSLMQY